MDKHGEGTFCGRWVTMVKGRWIDPEATGDDSVWRETCASHDSFMAEHDASNAPVERAVAMLDSMIAASTVDGVFEGWGPTDLSIVVRNVLDAYHD